jgi:hypothetical protein
MPELAKELSQELVELTRLYEQEAETRYMEVVRRVAQVRAMVKGENGAMYWDRAALRWNPIETSPDYDKESAPRFNHHINALQASWQILQGAIQTVGMPGVSFRPQNSSDPKDREAAERAEQIVQYEQAVFDFRDLMLGIYRLFFTDGIALAYTRYVPDANRFGVTVIPRDIKEPRVTQQAGYQCFGEECGAFTQQGQTMRDDMGGIQCPGCGGPMHAENFMPEQTEDVVVRQEQETVVNGREITDLYGALESFLPWWANDLDHAPYCKIVTEVTKEEVIAAFQDKEEEILSRGQEDRLGGLARQQARSPMNAPTGNDDGFITYGRWWFRPQCFYRVRSQENRKKLLKLFPEGVFFQLAGPGDNPAFLAAYPEKMETKLTLMRPFKGDGMYTPSIGQSGVPIQLSLNDSWNMALEGMLFAAFGQGYVDNSVFNAQAITQFQMKPGTVKGLDLPPGKTMRDSFFEMKSQDVGPSIQNFIQMAEPMLQWLMGTERVLSGGPVTNVRTSSGQAQARSQALQRQSPAYGAVKTGLAGIMEKTVNEFTQNRPAETFYEVVSESGDFEQLKIQLSPERGRVFAYPEASESIPQTWAQKADGINQMVESAAQNPVTQQWIAYPKNAQVVFDSWGIPELTHPQKAQFEKCERMIELLLQGKPNTTQMPNDLAPELGMVPVNQPSIPFDPVADDVEIFLVAFRDWAATKEGMQIQVENGPGYQNLRAYAEQAWTARKMAMAPPAQEAPPPTPQKQEQPA